jgi:hypothetical protein
MPIPWSFRFLLPPVRRPVRLLCLILVLLSLSPSACVTTLPYRTRFDGTEQSSASGTRCTTTEDRRCKVYYTVSEGDRDANAVHLAFVEFDEQGYQQADKLTDKVLEAIRDLADKKPLLMIVYAHGWKHNASAEDDNVKAFEELLARMAEEDHAACRLATSKCHDREVVGVYLGWRGLATRVEPFKELSFWQRKSRSIRAGIDGASQVVSELAAIRARSNALDAGRGEPGHTRLILTGHSFGAGLMYSATQQLLLRDMARAQDGQPIAGDVADLVVLVNPAIEAARARALKLAASKRSFPLQQLPLMAVFTSESDKATAIAFPLGRGLSTLLMHHTSEHADTAIASAANQRAENRTAMGQYEPWRTHTLDLTRLTEEQARKAGQRDLSTRTASLRNAACGWRKFQRNKEDGGSDTWSLDEMTLLRDPRVQGNRQRRNPYLFVKVNGKIIKDHSDIWGWGFSEFLYKFIAVQGIAADANRNCEPGQA